MSSRFAAGSTVGHYRIVSRIGAGGMGEVYKAQDTSLDRPVALKILPPELVKNQDRVRRFVQEAKAASGLSHPHIVTIHEVGEIPADAQQITRYIAMEFIHGVTLRAKIYDQRATLKELLEYLAQAADALAKAHAAGIVHRDLKPDNIMVTHDGYAKVLDFGLAKLIEKHEPGRSDSATAMREQTREGVVVGTLGYMSPEQVRGAAVDHRSDIFSLGCILYEAATKKKPFVADSDIDVLHKIVHDDPPPVSDIAPTVPAELRRMIRRCLAKDPDRRYQSMKDIAMELRDLSQEFETLGSGSMSAPTEALRFRRWRSWIPLALAIVGIAALVTALLMPRRSSTPVAPAANLVFSPLTSQYGIETHPRLSPDGNFVVYASNARGNFDIFLQRLAGLNAINLTASAEEDDSQPAVSPDGQFIAFRSDRDGGGIFVMGATGESVRRVSEEGFHPAWSPDGKEISYSTASWAEPMNRGARGQMWRVDVQTGAKKKVADEDATQGAWSPNGKWIAFWSVRNQGGMRDIALVPAAGGAPVWVTDDVAADWNPLWSPDGSSLYFISNRSGTMNLWRVGIDPDSGKPSGPPTPLTTPARNIGFIDSSRDGKKLVFAAIDTRSLIERIAMDGVTGSLGPGQPVLRGSMNVTQCAVSPDGQWVAFRTAGEREDLYLVRSDGTELRKLTDDVERDRGPSWSRDGKAILFYSDRSGRYDIWSIRPDGSGLRQITLSSGESIWFPQVSPDGKLLSVHNGEGSYVARLDGTLPASAIEPLPPLGRGEIFRASFWSPDGKFLSGTRTLGDSAAWRGVVLYSVADRTYTRLTDTGGWPGWLPDGRRLIYRDGKDLKLIDRITREVRTIGESGEETQTSASLSIANDGRAIYLVLWSSESDIWMMTKDEG